MTEQWLAGLTAAVAARLRGGFDDEAEIYQPFSPPDPSPGRKDLTEAIDGNKPAGDRTGNPHVRLVEGWFGGD